MLTLQPLLLRTPRPYVVRKYFRLAKLNRRQQPPGLFNALYWPCETVIFSKLTRNGDRGFPGRSEFQARVVTALARVGGCTVTAVHVTNTVSNSERWRRRGMLELRQEQ